MFQNFVAVLKENERVQAFFEQLREQHNLGQTNSQLRALEQSKQVQSFLGDLLKDDVDYTSQKEVSIPVVAVLPNDKADSARCEHRFWEKKLSFLINAEGEFVPASEEKLVQFFADDDTHCRGLMDYEYEIDGDDYELWENLDSVKMNPIYEPFVVAMTAGNLRFEDFLDTQVMADNPNAERLFKALRQAIDHNSLHKEVALGFSLKMEDALALSLMKEMLDEKRCHHLFIDSDFVGFLNPEGKFEGTRLERTDDSVRLNLHQMSFLMGKEAINAMPAMAQACKGIVPDGLEMKDNEFYTSPTTDLTASACDYVGVLGQDCLWGDLTVDFAERHVSDLVCQEVLAEKRENFIDPDYADCSYGETSYRCYF